MNTYQGPFTICVALASRKKSVLPDSVSSKKDRKSRLASNKESHRPAFHRTLELVGLNHQVYFPCRLKFLAVEVSVLHFQLF